MDRREFLKRTGVVVMGIRALNGTAIEEAFTEAVYDDSATHMALHRMALKDWDEVLIRYYLPPIQVQLNRQSFLLTNITEVV
jgi:hypothetical protein